MKKIFITVLITVLCTLLITTGVFATLGIDLVGMLGVKITAIATGATADTDAQLGTSEQSVVGDVSDYLTNYLNGISSEFGTYAQDQTNQAKLHMIDEGQQIKDTLDTNRQTLVDAGELQIRTDIEEKGRVKYNQLDKDLEDAIKAILQ